MKENIDIVNATIHDAAAIARLHANSWREHYKGMWSQTYLENECLSEREYVWKRRMEFPDPNQQVILAKQNDGNLIGFACTYLKHHEEFGTLLDNLHVITSRHGTGLGGRLLRCSARKVIDTLGDTPYYCWVLRDNTASKSFYIHMGAQEGVTELQKGPNGVSAYATMMYWASAKSLAED